VATFKEISAVLDSAIQDISQKKIASDAASKTAEIAYREYQDAMNKAQSLRQQLTDSLEESLGAAHSNVRVMSPKTA